MLHPIPRVIHQTWRTGEVEPPFRKTWQASWSRHHPAWTYRFWTDADLAAFVATEFPDFLACYIAYDQAIKRVDAARYLILKRLGGVFVDLDFVCLRPLDPLLSGHALVFGSQHPGDWQGTRDHVCNAFMASSPGHSFWQGIETDLLASAQQAEVVVATGPNFLTARASRADLQGTAVRPTVWPHHVLYPLTWNYPALAVFRNLDSDALAERFTDSAAVSLWTGVWRRKVANRGADNG